MRNARRSFLKRLAGTAGVVACGGGSLQAGFARDKAAYCQPDSRQVRDRFWVWGHVAGSHDVDFGLNATSRMTPAEGAFYLGVPNLLMVAIENPHERARMLPAPPYDQYAISFRPLKRVVWSIVGAGGRVEPKDIAMICDLARQFPNITGVIMDDFFHPKKEGGIEGAIAPEELVEVKKQLAVDARTLDLWVTFYRDNLKYDVAEYFKHIDVLTYWTWQGKDLMDLDQSFAEAEKTFPSTRKVLGCYMWDYGAKKPMPIPLMEKQCKLGLKWLRERRIEGMIFLATCICDLNLETVEWTRNWIREVGDHTL